MKVQGPACGRGRGSETRPATGTDYSIGEVAFSRALPRPPAALMAALVRFGPLVPPALAGLLLIVADFLTLREIRAVAAVPEGGTVTGGAHHGYALALIGAVMALMAFGAALGGSRPAAVALLILSLAAVGIVLLVDLPVLDDAGLIGRNYDLARAHPAAGFYVECAGAALGLLSALVLLRRRARPRRPATRRPRRAVPS